MTTSLEFIPERRAGLGWASGGAELESGGNSTNQHQLKTEEEKARGGKGPKEGNPSQNRKAQKRETRQKEHREGTIQAPSRARAEGEKQELRRCVAWRHVTECGAEPLANHARILKRLW